MIYGASTCSPLILNKVGGTTFCLGLCGHCSHCNIKAELNISIRRINIQPLHAFAAGVLTKVMSWLMSVFMLLSQ